jgi:hypothetical protein
MQLTCQVVISENKKNIFSKRIDVLGQSNNRPCFVEMAGDSSKCFNHQTLMLMKSIVRFEENQKITYGEKRQSLLSSRSGRNGHLVSSNRRGRPDYEKRKILIP